MPKKSKKIVKICNNCKYFKVKKLYDTPTYGYAIYQCWRYPQRYNTLPEEFCGEFKEK
jgi:hypothetical protein